MNNDIFNLFDDAEIERVGEEAKYLEKKIADLDNEIALNNNILDGNEDWQYKRDAGSDNVGLRIDKRYYENQLEKVNLKISELKSRRGRPALPQKDTKNR